MIKTNKELGITLIALVVTIIILLILAGVTIGFAMNGTGLFDKAKLATDEYNNKVEKENYELGKLSNDIDISSSRQDITINEDELNRLIDKRIDERLENLGEITSLNNGTYGPLKELKNRNVSGNNATEMTSFSITPGSYIILVTFGTESVNNTASSSIFSSISCTNSDNKIVGGSTHLPSSSWGSVTSTFIANIKNNDTLSIYGSVFGTNITVKCAVSYVRIK